MKDAENKGLSKDYLIALFKHAYQGEHARAKWAVDRLREMNRAAHTRRKLWATISKEPARKPDKPLRTSDHESVLRWLRYLAHRSRSQHGEVLQHGWCLRKGGPAHADGNDGNAAIDALLWIKNDLLYKAPEQVEPVVRDAYLSRIDDAVMRARQGGIEAKP